MKQILITPAAGKRLIAKALLTHPSIQRALKNGTVVIIAGTTNGYIAEEILNAIGEMGFSRKRFFRGLTMPPAMEVTNEGRLADESQFPGDVIIVKGKWQKGKTIAEVADFLVEGDVIVKGANAVDLIHKQAAILIGHPKAGTIGYTIPAVAGRRVKLIVAAGLEKRVNCDLNQIATKLNEPEAEGYRLLPISGELFTELEAIKCLFGVNAELFAAGGVCGAEGGCWLLISGNKKQVEYAEKTIKLLANEPVFDFKI